MGFGITYGAGGGSSALDGWESWAMMASTSLAAASPRGLAVTLSDARIERRK